MMVAAKDAIINEEYLIPDNRFRYRRCELLGRGRKNYLSYYFFREVNRSSPVIIVRHEDQRVRIAPPRPQE